MREPILSIKLKYSDGEFLRTVHKENAAMLMTNSLTLWKSPFTAYAREVLPPTNSVGEFLPLAAKTGLQPTIQ